MRCWISYVDPSSGGSGYCSINANNNVHISYLELWQGQQYRSSKCWTALVRWTHLTRLRATRAFSTWHEQIPCCFLQIKPRQHRAFCRYRLVPLYSVPHRFNHNLNQTKKSQTEQTDNPQPHSASSLSLPSLSLRRSNRSALLPAAMATEAVIRDAATPQPADCTEMDERVRCVPTV